MGMRDEIFLPDTKNSYHDSYQAKVIKRAWSCHRIQNPKMGLLYGNSWWQRDIAVKGGKDGLCNKWC